MRIRILILMAIMPFMVSAQRLNSRGEKMISKIETQSCNFRTGEIRKGTTYTFKYDDNNRIVGLTMKNAKEQQYIVKNGKNIERTYFYDKKTQEKTIKYEYLLDESGNIIQKIYYEAVGNPLTFKQVWNFLYRYDDFSGRVLLDSVSYSSLYRDIHKGMRDYDFCDGETEPFTLKVNRTNEGLYYTVCFATKNYTQKIDDKVEYAIGLYDDTNLNLNYLWGGASYTIGGDSGGALEFLVPEWANAKAGYLYSCDPNYEYVPIKDKKGNIERVEEYNRLNGKLRQIFIITYVE